ncbi:hypothetical protein D9756_002708 [Leucocoprinus leucothites]|uniref:Uncharacterized protein n=1 Tax=Leucocoprinus leucothites TaxID=201217 RepID=A0A8H5GBV3_9AGAR|nr:hypothetical protein D9756_002708 [Leucoagaricus leucothites]
MAPRTSHSLNSATPMVNPGQANNQTKGGLTSRGPAGAPSSQSGSISQTLPMARSTVTPVSTSTSLGPVNPPQIGPLPRDALPSSRSQAGATRSSQGQSVPRAPVSDTHSQPRNRSRTGSESAQSHTPGTNPQPSIRSRAGSTSGPAPSVTSSRPASISGPLASTTSSQPRSQSRGRPAITSTASSRHVSRSREPPVSRVTLDLNSLDSAKLEIADQAYHGWFCVAINPDTVGSSRIAFAYFWIPPESNGEGGAAWKIKHYNFEGLESTHKLSLVPQAESIRSLSMGGSVLTLLVLSRAQIPENKFSVIEKALKKAVEVTNNDLGLRKNQLMESCIKHALLYLVSAKMIQTKKAGGLAVNITPLWEEVDQMINNAETLGNHFGIATNSW